jgi:hypothetical protein
MLANIGDLKLQNTVSAFTISRKPQEVVDAALSDLEGQAPTSKREPLVLWSSVLAPRSGTCAKRSL